MNLQELNTQIHEKTKVANTNLDNHPRTARPAWEIAIRKAKDEIEKLTKEHKTAVVSSMLALFPVGPKDVVNAFCFKAQKLAEAFIVDASVFYRSVSTPVWKAAPRPGTVSIAQVALANSYLKTTLFDTLKLEDFKTPDYSKMPFYHTEDELFSYLKDSLRKVDSDKYNSQILINKLDELVLSSKTSKSTIPVIFTNTTEPEARALAALFTNLGAQTKRVDNVFTLTEDLDEDSIMGLLGKVKSKSKK